MGGDLDLSRETEVVRRIRWMERRRPPVLVLDLRGATFIDSTMLRVILAAYTRARAERRRLVVAVGSESVRRLFRITLLEWRLEVVDDPANVDVGDRGRPQEDRARNHR